MQPVDSEARCGYNFKDAICKTTVMVDVTIGKKPAQNRFSKKIGLTQIGPIFFEKPKAEKGLLTDKKDLNG